jgi:hypothetical protein
VRTRSDPLGVLWGDLPIGPPSLHQRGEFASGRFAEPTIAKLLDTVGDGTSQQVSAEPRWLTSIEASPLFAQLVRTERRKSLEEPRHLCVASRPICFDHGNYTAFKMR